MAGLLTCFIAACGSQPTRVNYNFPTVPAEPRLGSAVVDKNDKSGEAGIWMNTPDVKADLEYRAKLQTIIEQLRVYWEAMQK